MDEEIVRLIQECHSIRHELSEVIAKGEYVDDPRNVLSIGYLDQIFEHHESILTLITAGLTGSALALVRSIVETTYRCLWADAVASNAEIEKIIKKDDFPVNMKVMGASLDVKLGTGDLFESFTKRSWKAMCSYAHSGMLQVGRRFTGHDVRPSYKNEEISEAINVSTAVILLAIPPILIRLERTEDWNRVNELASSFRGLSGQSNNAPSE